MTDTAITRREWLAGTVQRRGSVVVLALVIVVSSFAFDSFATVDNARNIAMQASFLSIVALGMTFVILSGGIDLSVGSVYALGGVLAAFGVKQGSLVGILLPLLVCGGIGLLNGVLVAYGRLAPFIVTLATLLGARGLLLAITNEGANTRVMPRDAVLTQIGQGTLLGVGYPVWIAIVLFVIGVFVLQRTRFGHSVLAIGGSAEAAKLMGLPVARRTMWLYTASGLLAGLAGALAAADPVGEVAGRLAVDHLVVEAGQRLLVCGENGAGKSTLVAVMSGDLRPDAGTVTRNGRVGYLPQECAAQRPDRTVLAAFSLGRVGSVDEHSARLVSLGLFRESDLLTPVGSLSVGQRRRLALARLLVREVDVLLLDEPTNHLSLTLVEELEAALADYPGAVVVVSHDRLFRRRWTGPELEIRAGRPLRAMADA
ncbi:ATP-binding cassette domain-containing protein [Kibdelosporangium lantanae]|uniref:ATP-binding cassette domain-containing protein n=1 Tax=Kibdelosporangium lantanae TaxID=1497396 RepID=A0ABW3M5U5_9PSEU